MASRASVPAAALGFLLLLLPYPLAVHSLRANDLFYLTLDDSEVPHGTTQVPASCSAYEDVLDSSLTEAKDMVDGAVAAVDLIVDADAGDEQRADQVYFSMLFAALFNPSALLVTETSQGFAQVKDTFGAYQAALQGSRQARKQVFCDDDWLEFRGADDADPVWQAQNPFAEASPPLMRDTHEAWFAEQAPDHGLWNRKAFPPGIDPTYENTLVYDPDLPAFAPRPICNQGSQGASAMVSTDFDTLTLCPLLMDNIAGELGEDLAGGGVLAEGTRIDALQLYSLSLSWVHELLHWIPSVNFIDEPAVDLASGQPMPGELAYGWRKSVALAQHRRDVAARNVENYVMFAKAVYLRKLAPEWSFLTGVAVPVKG